MAVRRWSIPAGLILLTLGVLVGCAPQPSLPVGPTPIPTLVPATDVPRGLQSTPTAAFTIMSYPAQEPQVAAGQQIYVSECANCHGADGTGAVPAARNFRDLDYMRGEAPASFYVAVTEGRGEMPAYRDRLSSDERWDVVFYVWRLATSSETLALGQQIYQEHCAACHGEAGAGELLGSADFTDLREMDQLAPRDLYLTITQGRGSMPAWQSRLTQDERWAVIDYLRTFSYNPSLDQETAASPAPPTEAPTTCDPDQSNPFDWGNAEAVAAGEALFTAECAACHGGDGSGGLPNTPDFTAAEVSADLRAGAGEAFCVLTEGEDAMPAFGESLSAGERWQVMTFLASLAP